MIALDHHSAFVSGRAVSRTAPAAATRFARLVRAVPICLRISSFAVINTVIVIALAGMVWNGIRMVGAAWDDVLRLRESEAHLTGLGLHVIFNIVTQSLGGRLAIDSAPRRGTTFRITIPRHATAAAATTE